MVFIVDLSSACRSRTLFTCYLGTPSPPFDCSSACVLRGGASVLGGGATETSSSSDHSDIAALRVRVVWSSPSEMLPGLRGTTPAVFLFFQASSSVAALFPRTFSNTEDGLSVRPASAPLDSDEMLTAPSSGYVGGRASTAYDQLLLGTPKKYTTLSYEWNFA